MPPQFNYEPLTPTAFLARAAVVFGDRLAVADDGTRFTYREFHARCLRFAGALRKLGVAPGERVAVFAPNTHVLLAAHYAVPLAGAVLVALNTRITADDIAYILEHAGVRVLIYDDAYAETALNACSRAHAGVLALRAGGER
ncbi:MAG TPA: AMP-binding protein, partial [Casimicrobiaceae bacterium]|nr:AMP-binding protein [Casimicrobiaceae bacterium]